MKKFSAVKLLFLSFIFIIILSLGTGYGDVSYNPRRNLLGAISLQGKIAYHLYHFDTSRNEKLVKLYRKSKWQIRNNGSQGDTFFFVPRLPWLHLVNFITGLDFNPAGESAATIDYCGNCVVSDINTGNCDFHLSTPGFLGNLYSKNYFNNLLLSYTVDSLGRCRWSTNPAEPLLFVKYDYRQLNILDVEKKALTLKEPVQIESDEGNCN